MGMKGDKGSDGLPGRTGPPGKDVCVIDVKDFFLQDSTCMVCMSACLSRGQPFWGVCLQRGSVYFWELGGLSL